MVDTICTQISQERRNISKNIYLSLIHICKRLDKAPYVCNGCTKKINHCTIAHKYYYNGRAAAVSYTHLIVLDVPVRAPKEQFVKLDACDKAIESTIDFRNLFKWFRNQEDIENHYQSCGKLSLLCVQYITTY